MSVQFGVRPSISNSITVRRILFAQAEQAAKQRLEDIKRQSAEWRKSAAEAEERAARAEERAAKAKEEEAKAKAETEAALVELGRIKLAEMFPNEPQAVAPMNRLTGHQILTETAAKHGFSIEEVKSAGTQKLLCLCRQEACYRMTAETWLSMVQIGRILGGRDHTSVRRAVIVHCERTGLPLPRGITPSPTPLPTLRPAEIESASHSEDGRGGGTEEAA